MGKIMKKTLKALLLTLVVLAAASCSKNGGTEVSTLEEAKQVAAKAAMADLRTKSDKPVEAWALCPASKDSQVLVVIAGDGRGRAVMRTSGRSWEITQGADEGSYSKIACAPFSKESMERVIAGDKK
jgi:hypothetical protein